MKILLLFLFLIISSLTYSAYNKNYFNFLFGIMQEEYYDVSSINKIALINNINLYNGSNDFSIHYGQTVLLPMYFLGLGVGYNIDLVSNFKNYFKLNPKVNLFIARYFTFNLGILFLYNNNLNIGCNIVYGLDNIQIVSYDFNNGEYGCLPLKIEFGISFLFNNNFYVNKLLNENYFQILFNIALFNNQRFRLN